MKICITVGHSILKDGRCTSADGRPYGGVLEYVYCRDFAKKYLVPELKKTGHKVELIICPEKKFATKYEERGYKVPQINKGNYDLLMELHLNSAAPTAAGTEVLYCSAAGKRYAEAICNQLGKVYRNRGAKKRSDLYILNQTKPVAVVLELFFCTNNEDYKKGHGKTNASRLARLIVAGIDKV